MSQSCSLAEMPAEIIHIIVLRLECVDLAHFASSCRYFYQISVDRIFVNEWLRSYSFPFSVAMKVSYSSRGSLGVCRLVHDAHVSSIRALRTLEMDIGHDERDNIRKVFSIHKDRSLRWASLWAVCLTNNCELARAIYGGYLLFGEEPTKEEASSADVYFDLLFRHNRWEDAKKDLAGRLLDGGRWDMARVPNEYLSLFLGGEAEQGFGPKGDGSYRLVEDRSILEKMHAMESALHSATSYRIFRSPAFSAENMAKIITRGCDSFHYDPNIHKLALATCALYSLYSRGQGYSHFIERGLDLEGVSKISGYDNWRSMVSEKLQKPPPTAMMAAAIFMREGMDEDSLDPLYDILFSSLPAAT